MNMWIQIRKEYFPTMRRIRPSGLLAMGGRESMDARSHLTGNIGVCQAYIAAARRKKK